jgi:hypothetical protein
VQYSKKKPSEEGKKKAICEPFLLGISQALLKVQNIDKFLSYYHTAINYYPYVFSIIIDDNFLYSILVKLSNLFSLS